MVFDAVASFRPPSCLGLLEPFRGLLCWIFLSKYILSLRLKVWVMNYKVYEILIKFSFICIFMHFVMMWWLVRCVTWGNRCDPFLTALFRIIGGITSHYFTLFCIIGHNIGRIIWQIILHWKPLFVQYEEPCFGRKQPLFGVFMFSYFPGKTTRVIA